MTRKKLGEEEEYVPPQAIDHDLEELYAAFRARRLSKAALADWAQVHHNVIRHFGDSERFHPSIKTIRKLQWRLLSDLPNPPKVPNKPRGRSISATTSPSAYTHNAT